MAAFCRWHLDEFSIQQFRLAGFFGQSLKIFECHQFYCGWHNNPYLTTEGFAGGHKTVSMRRGGAMKKAAR